MRKIHNYDVNYDGTDKGHEKSAMPVPHSESADSGSGPAMLHENVLDSHHDTLMKADAIKGNPHIMKQLKPHMEKKMGHMKKILSIDGLKAAAKEKMKEE